MGYHTKRLFGGEDLTATIGCVNGRRLSGYSLAGVPSVLLHACAVVSSSFRPASCDTHLCVALHCPAVVSLPERLVTRCLGLRRSLPALAGGATGVEQRAHQLPGGREMHGLGRQGHGEARLSYGHAAYSQSRKGIN